jgi:HK97 gp10 family phage protein
VIEVHGLRELDDRLRRLSDQLRDPILRAGMEAGAEVIRQAAIARAPRRTGRLAAELAVRMFRVRTLFGPGGIMASIGAQSRDLFYARFLEWGALPHRIKPRNKRALTVGGRLVGGVDHPGVVPRPFLGPALAASAEPAVQRAAQVIRERLESSPDVVRRR